ncbi:hypothetical protein ACIBCT_35830 [Streptosporangium sp. NPDC050855]|uniref:hypothetical protein n=1 Tax=Streptosporangium sp. NPDC050855 TaxID=3366194 RepID=UPI003793AC58
MSLIDDTDETTLRTYYMIRMGIMFSTICAAGLSLGDQSQLAMKIMGWNGWGGGQAYFLPGSVIALEVVCLIIYNVVRDHHRKTLIFRWSIVATVVSASLNVIWSRIHNGYDVPSEWLVWYIAVVPNAMLLASLKVGTYLTPPRKKQPLPLAEIPAQEEAQEEQEKVEEEEPLPPPPPNEDEEREEEEKPEPPKPPFIFPLPDFGQELPRKTVLICLKEIAERKTADPYDDLADLTGAWLEQEHKMIGRRGWINAKREATALWEKEPAKWRQLLLERQSA